MDEQILHAAASLCFNNFDRNSSAVQHDDHVAVSTDINGIGHINVKVFHPQLFERIRQKYHISTGEIIAELQSGPFITSDLAGDFDEGSYFSSRERLVVSGLADDKLSSFRETLQSFTDHQLHADETFLPVIIGFFQVETRAKMKSKTNTFLITRSIFPRQGHDYMHFLDLKGCTTRQCDGGFLKDGDVTWEHEISFPPSERSHVIETLRRDTELLQNSNLTNYSLIVVITQRHLNSSKQKPGQPYGPDNDNEEDDRKKTLPLRHDVADGAKPIRADLVPKPRFCDEHPEWSATNFPPAFNELLIGNITSDSAMSILLLEQRQSLQGQLRFSSADSFSSLPASLPRAFKMAFGAKQEEMSSLPPADYAERFLEFMETKVSLFFPLS
jgi:hypothetical protein